MSLQLPIKRILDVVISLTLVLVGLPAFILIGVLVWFDSPGPIIFRQVRTGLHGKEFVLWKFRTMTIEAALLRNPDGSARVERGDARVTRVGRLLREFGFDELPQLLNVLVGQMSLVGPRPYMPVHTAMLEGEARCRNDMRPGVVGLPEVSGRNSIPWSRRLELDAHYVRHWSLWLDAVILCRVVPVVLFRKGVYTPPKESRDVGTKSH